MKNFSVRLSKTLRYSLQPAHSSLIAHALYLLGEYFYSKDEFNKSKEFFEQIVVLENVNSNIRIEAQKRIQRDFSE